MELINPSHFLSCVITSPLCWFWTALWVVTGEWSPLLDGEQCRFQGRGHTLWHLPSLPDWLTTFLSIYYPVILHLSVSSIHPVFDIFLGPVRLWRWTHSFSSKFLEPPTQPCSMISQNTWIRISSVGISNLALNYLWNILGFFHYSVFSFMVFRVVTAIDVEGTCYLRHQDEQE